ncbi:uncharacterized protein LOC122351709 [Puntigrus tetrazona]|uniref:uncharacterized protein LOC122351709 n=1 Tax=Puntigrus tetrazona TaxID=1606681 RepID=UPI001C896FA2|nr:uncharacterized protein LOC122351709 [Puntigrus tetrazona]
MERTRLLITLMFFLFYQKSSFGEEVEMKVRPGENITLFCDRSLSVGLFIVWIRNCSHENQPSLIIDFRQGFKWDLKIFQRFSLIHNPYNNSLDLHITNVTVSDLGLYYCAEVENKVNKDEKGIISSSIVYYYGNQTTRLSLEKVTSCSEASAPPDCVLCWTLLFSVCPVCVLLSSLLSSICVFCLCCKKSTDAANDQKDKVKGRNTAECTDEEVCYASLDVISKRQKQGKTKRVQSSDFSTYAQVRT